MLVLKLKGVKKAFSGSPIDVKHLRKEDIHVPAKRHLAGNTTSVFQIAETTVTEICPVQKVASDHLILYCPGGAFVYGPTELNWKTIAQIVKHTKTKAWLLNYPKAPEANIEQITRNIDQVYAEALKTYQPENIILMGDSVGGNLMISLVQRLINAGESFPSRLIAISPVLDASMTNHAIEQLDKKDPILSKNGVLSAKKMCAGETSLKDPIISPLYGSFKGFPATHLFVAEHDIMLPDQKLAIHKMTQEGVETEVIEGTGMPHIWPLLPVMSEAQSALSKIEGIVLQQVNRLEEPQL